MKKGTVIRAPWRVNGDDKNLTGLVVKVSKGFAHVIWNADGDVTQAGDESTFPVANLTVDDIVSLVE